MLNPLVDYCGNGCMSVRGHTATRQLCWVRQYLSDPLFKATRGMKPDNASIDYSDEISAIYKTTNAHGQILSIVTT